ncbi:uncharacterized protein [Watersipora subatra]|uniref:uncharacterized protein n=1 Tax=Watersipora subatra TaxID=2589382 RepID=UPI00355C45FD
MLQPQQPPQQQFAVQLDGTTAMGNPRRAGYQLEAAALTQMKWLSFFQVVIGGLCILLGIILIPVKASMFYWRLTLIAYSICCGAYFAIVGGVGLGAFAHNTIRWIIATMVLNIISLALFSIQLFIMPVTNLAINSSASCGSYIYSSCSVKTFALSLNGLLVLISIAEFSIAIWSAVLCCRGICPCCFSVSPDQYVQDAYPALLTQRQNLDFSAVVPNYQINAGGYQAVSALVHKQPPSG